jgi:16S rRNA (guanine1207-N2)-methyltransferase
MSDVSAALQYAFDTAGLDASGDGVLILLPEDTKLSSSFPRASVWHPAADAAASWSQRGHPVLSDLESAEKFSTVIVYVPRQKEEAQTMMAYGLKLLKAGGLLVAAASNLAGGQTLVKQIGLLGLEVQSVSKLKCRVIWSVTPESADTKKIDKAIKVGAMQEREDGSWSQPGLFSWKQQDKGTSVLLQHLPFSLAGTGADFGSGIGVIGQRLLKRYAAIDRLYNIDSDARAIACCAKNLEPWKAKCDFMWADVLKLSHLPKLDFIVTNPPFHQGKAQAIGLGQGFIESASEHLKPGGMLVLVANVHLPYEALLPKYFSMHRIACEQDGFKVIEAIR